MQAHACNHESNLMSHLHCLLGFLTVSKLRKHQTHVSTSRLPPVCCARPFLCQPDPGNNVASQCIGQLQGFDTPLLLLSQPGSLDGPNIATYLAVHLFKPLAQGIGACCLSISTHRLVPQALGQLFDLLGLSCCFQMQLMLQ